MPLRAYRFRTFLKALGNPLDNLNSIPQPLSRFLVATPITPLLDILSASLSMTVLACKGLPLQTAMGSILHLLCRREDDYLDKLHLHDTLARIRLCFSLVWTSGLLLSSSSQTSKGMNRVSFWINIASLILILARSLRRSTPIGAWRQHLDAFNERCEKHSVDPTFINPVYHWVANSAIWMHAFILVLPLKDLLISFAFWKDPFTTLFLYVKTYTKDSVILTACFLLASLLGAIMYALGSLVFPNHFSPWGRDTTPPSTIVIGTVSCIVYGFLVRWFCTEKVDLTIWGMSDGLLWAGFEAWLAYCMMMLDDGKTAYRSRRMQEEAEGKEGHRMLGERVGLEVRAGYMDGADLEKTVGDLEEINVYDKI